jgi:hypothetical protein
MDRSTNQLQPVGRFLHITTQLPHSIVAAVAKEWLCCPFPCQAGSLSVPDTVSVSAAGQAQLLASCAKGTDNTPQTKHHAQHT